MDELLIAGYFVLAVGLGYGFFRWISNNNSKNDTGNNSIYRR